MRIPRATYRIQFTQNFRFADAQKIVDYLAKLGISDLYASPIFKARSGSTHGYDVVDPTQINPELGGEAGFDTLIQALQARQMGWLQDIVPNHMAYDTENQWLMDVLENGPASEYVPYFDIAWNSPFESNQEPILVPLLGSYYGEALENGDLKLNFDQNGLSVSYYNLRIPLRLESYGTFFTQNLPKLGRELGRRDPAFMRLMGILYMLRTVSPETTGNERHAQNAFIKDLLWELYTTNDAVKVFVDENLQIFNGEPGKPESFNLLDTLLTDQFFRLAYWKVGAEEMNYRRFFTVNELISIRVEEPRVFDRTHELIARLVQEGKFTGLRIDHIDGLFDPTQYLDRLRARMGDVYITVEKILQAGEHLPPIWDTQGTSGYDYMNFINSIFCRPENEAAFDELYIALTGIEATFDEIADDKKRLIISDNLAGDLDNMALWLKYIASRHRYGNDFTLPSLRRAISEVLVQYPVYRTYTNRDGVLDQDRPYIEEVTRIVLEQTTLLSNELNFIKRLLLLNYDDNLSDAEKEQWLQWAMRTQQYTGPLTAKGVEDTAIYIYNRLLARNEVGGSPERFGIPLEEFHEFNRVRQEKWVVAMSATATHDTKRGEDVRARLNVLSEMPDEWQQCVRRWREINLPHKMRVRAGHFPNRNDEYAFYQVLLGSFPTTQEEYPEFVTRIKDYMLKAMREAKVNTTWSNNNARYEGATMAFIEAVMADGKENAFLADFRPFQQRIAFYGMLNSLAQTLIKIATPGIPDFYQGTELWDLSLVDPDNRRPVDFGKRQKYLDQLQKGIQQDPIKLIGQLCKTWRDGRLKMLLTTQALQARQAHLPLFNGGEYVALEATGECGDNVVAFARRKSGRNGGTLLAITPRFCTSLVRAETFPVGHNVWQATHLTLPRGFPTVWHNAITGEELSSKGTLRLGDALQHFPVALLVGG